MWVIDIPLSELKFFVKIMYCFSCFIRYCDKKSLKTNHCTQWGYIENDSKLEMCEIPFSVVNLRQNGLI